MHDIPPFPSVPQARHRLLRGSNEDHETFTGLYGELTYDTTNKTARVHDGETLGGFLLSKEGHEHTLDAITDLPKPGIESAGKFLRVGADGSYGLADTSTSTTTESIIDASPLGRTLMRAADSHIVRTALGIPVPTLADVGKTISVDESGNLALVSSGFQLYDTAGSYTFTAPHTGWFKVTVTGAGGGAGAAANGYAGYGAASAGANAGGTAIKRIYLQKGEVILVTVGAGGNGVAWSALNPWGVNGVTGGTSSFGSYCSATGGFGSTTTPNAPANANTITYGVPHAQYQSNGIGGDLNLIGGTGASGCFTWSGTAPGGRTAIPGTGGNSYWSGGGYGGMSSASPNGGPGRHGSGGGGARASGGVFAGSGGRGGDGVVLIEG